MDMNRNISNIKKKPQKKTNREDLDWYLYSTLKTKTKIKKVHYQIYINTKEVIDNSF